MLSQQDNDAQLLEQMRKINERLYSLERKMDVLADLLKPKTPESKSAPKVSKPLNPMDFYAHEGNQHQRNAQPNAQRNHQNNIQPNHLPKERTMYSAVCADCGQACSIPFKPTGERPVYCKDCFSRRKNPNSFKAKEEEKQAVSEVQQVIVSEVQQAAISDRQEVKTKKSKKTSTAAKTKKKMVKAKKASTKKATTKKSKRK